MPSPICQKNPLTPFEEIEVSTQTIICKTNWRINLKKLYDILPLTEFVIHRKKRGRKPKTFVEKPIQTLEDGAVITLKLGDQMKGVNLKKNRKGFRNSLTMVIQTNGKFINVKISKCGKFQITGSKSGDNAQKFIEYLKKYADVHDKTVPNSQKILSVKYNSSPEVIFIDVMTNIHFSLGFMVSRENLDRYMNTQKNYFSLLETSFGYTGLNIKVPLKNIDKMPVRRILFKEDQWLRDDITYTQYIESLSDKEQEKEKAKVRHNTFLVFQSGNIILSSSHKNCMKQSYEDFQEIIKNCRNLIEEKPLIIT